MELGEFIDNLRTNLSKGKTEKTFDSLSGFLKSNNIDLYNRLIILSNQFYEPVITCKFLCNKINFTNQGA